MCQDRSRYICKFSFVIKGFGEVENKSRLNLLNLFDRLAEVQVDLVFGHLVFEFHQGFRYDLYLVENVQFVVFRVC